MRLRNFVGYVKIKDGTIARGMCGFCRSTNVKMDRGAVSCNDCGTVNAGANLIEKKSRKKVVHDSRGHFSQSDV